ncbi:HAMP domain-containing protein [Bacillus sp. B1-b2]|nr:methyl-accepting chemotaxis protein [Bacillus sp. B1-b2]KAB7671758.1 HAMP domain-containing protein [Bacillus sp. B1-b2]
MKIGHKVLLGFSVLFLFIVAFAVVGILGNAKNDRDIDNMINKGYKLVSLSTEMEENVANRVILARGYVLYGEEKDRQQFIALTDEAKTIQAQLKEMLGNTDEYKEAVEKNERWENLILNQVIPAYDEGGMNAALPLMEEYCQIWATEAMDSWIGIQQEAEQNMLSTADELADTNDKQSTIFTALAIITAFSVLVVAGWLTYFMVKPIKVITERLMQVSKNNLSFEPLVFNRKDEFGILANALNESTENLSNMVKQIKDTEASILENTTELTTSREIMKKQADTASNMFNQVAEGSTMQLEGASETATAMEHVSKAMGSISESTVSVADYSSSVNNYALEGNSIVIDTIKKLNDMSGTVDQTVTTMDRLEHRTGRIGEISTLINDISEQTNLLALNATIEAARAGEQGKGFAVVASEIRNLAERSRESSKEIAKLIEGIKQEINVAVHSTIKNKEEMEASLFAANNAGLAFKNISAAIEKISAQVQEVSSSSEEVTASVEEISASIEQLATIARENVDNVGIVSESAMEQQASMEAVEQTVEDLNILARELNSLMERFVLKEND